jgi:hypothetical protein
MAILDLQGLAPDVEWSGGCSNCSKCCGGESTLSLVLC